MVTSAAGSGLASNKRRKKVWIFTIAGPTLPCAGAIKHTSKPKLPDEEVLAAKTPILWRDPNISSLNLFYGPGGKEHQPRAGGKFKFIEEDLHDTNPKVVVEDDAGTKWTVKLGSEARPEIAATRLVWAAGYFASEVYFLNDLQVQNMPRRLHRGQRYVLPDGSLRDVRLKRHLEGEKKIGNWRWRKNRFSGTRELNGLRVVLALVNDWDLTDENNAIYVEPDGRGQESQEAVYMVSDLGSTFGTAGLVWPLRKARGNLRG